MAARLPQHPSDRFAQAFLRAQQASGKRSRYLAAWPLFEFWKDEVKDVMAAVDEFIEPLVKDALEKKARSQSSAEKISDEEIFLEHLVHQTDGR